MENAGKRQYSLEQFVEGTIYSIYQTDKAILEPIFESAGRILGKIHSIPTIGFGDLDENYSGK